MTKAKNQIDASPSTNQEKYWDDIEDDPEFDEPVVQPGKGRRRGRGAAGALIPIEDAKTRRLELNRQSAKESRKRKKSYMCNLEDKNKTLEMEKARLMRRINSLEERNRLNYLSHVDTTEQLLEGRQHLYDRLEECLAEEDQGDANK